MSDKKVKFLGVPIYIKNNEDEYAFKIGKLPLFKVKYIAPKQVVDQKNRKEIKCLSQNVRIGIQLKGGIGDQLVGCNYVNMLSNKLADNNIKIDVFCRKYIKELFLQKQTFINKIYPEQNFDIKDGKYDVYIRLDRFPVVLWYDEKQVQKNVILLKYIKILEDFRKAYPRFFNFGTGFDGMSAIYSIINKKKRIQQCDVDAFLGIEEKISYKIILPESSVLDDYHLKGRTYITVHRGCDTNHTQNSNKLWPLEAYNKLIGMIKEQYPQYLVVQLGVNEVRCPPMQNIDINLVGKTQLTDIPDILKHSLLHIDSEGGFVHIRHAVEGGISVVLFGPTSKEFFGYSENINIRSTICPHWCEHIREKWDEKCILTNGEALCMKSISVEEVYSEVAKFLSERKVDE